MASELDPANHAKILDESGTPNQNLDVPTPNAKSAEVAESEGATINLAPLLRVFVVGSATVDCGNSSVVPTVTPDVKYPDLATLIPPSTRSAPVDEDESKVLLTFTVLSNAAFPVVNDNVSPFPPEACRYRLPLSFLSVKPLTPPSLVRVEELKKRLAFPTSLDNSNDVYAAVPFDELRIFPTNPLFNVPANENGEVEVNDFVIERVLPSS